MPAVPAVPAQARRQATIIGVVHGHTADINMEEAYCFLEFR